MVPYIGDYRLGQTVRHLWNTFGSSNQSITRSTNGTVSVYEDGGLTQFTTGVTDTEDYDGRTGIHEVVIVTTDSQYERGKDYYVVLDTATIDGQTVNAALFTFSIENREPSKDKILFTGNLTAATANTITLPSGASTTNGAYDGAFVQPVGGTGSGQTGRYLSTSTTYNGTSLVATLSTSFVTTLGSDTDVIIFRDYAETVVLPTVTSGNAHTDVKKFGGTTVTGANISSEVTAVKAKTDDLTFTVTKQVDSNPLSMNSQDLSGDGSDGNRFRGA